MRALYTTLGLAALAAGLAGLVLPLLPTVPFLILAAFLFGRGHPALERWLVEHPRFGTHIQAWRQRRAISRGARRAAFLAFAASAAIGVASLDWPWSALPLLVAAVGAAWIASLPVDD